MELPIKNFKISTKKKETPNSKANPMTLRPLQSKTPLKNIKAQSKSHTPNRNVRKIIAVKGPPFNMVSMSTNIEKPENLGNLPKILCTPLLTEENHEKMKTEADKISIKPQKNEENKPVDSMKTMISLFFRNKIRSLLYFIQRRDLSQNIKVELTNLLTALNLRKKNGLIVRDDILFRLNRLITTRSKFRYKDKIDYFKAAILKTINYDIKTRILLHPQRNDSSDSEHEKDHGNPNEDRKSRHKSVIPKVLPQRNLSTPNSHLIFRDDPKKFANNANEKIFIVVGGYDDLKDALKTRGWTENTNPLSSRFDFKWTLKIKDIEYNKLKDHQIVNHFEKNSCLTSKVGVCRNMRNLIGSDLIDIDEFYPRCYDLEDANDFEDFIEEFKFTKAEGLVKEFFKMKGSNIDKNRELVIKVAMAAIGRKILDVYEKIHQIGMGVLPVILQEEWAILEDLTTKHYDKSPDYYSKIMEKYNQFINNLMGNLKEKEKDKDKDKEKEKDKGPTLLEQCEFILQELQRNNPQYHLNGSRNIWILKPSLLSRGRGIKCFNNLTKILDFVFQKKIPYVCQKYIENPLIIKRKKFDIRQWVLVTDWSPLTVWFYEICYVRFGADEYDPNDLSNSHLTNNSIAKYSEKFASSEIKGNMWSMDEFAIYVKNITNQDIFYDKIQPRMKKIVIDVLKSVEDMVLYRKRSMELYGFDFMIDENLNPWIIEINSSPAMDYSTQITEKLVKMVMEDVVKVTVDYAQAKNKKGINTGNFNCIYQGNVKS